MFRVVITSLFQIDGTLTASSSFFVLRGQGIIDGKGQWWRDTFQFHSSKLSAGRPHGEPHPRGNYQSHLERLALLVLASCPHPDIRSPRYAPDADGIESTPIVVCL
jgi:hypothetical protein